MCIQNYKGSTEHHVTYVHVVHYVDSVDYLYIMGCVYNWLMCHYSVHTF